MRSNTRAGNSRFIRHPRPFHGELGIALLTVLVILTVMAIFGAAFVQQVRIQLSTTGSFSNRQIVGDVATGSISLVEQDFNVGLNGPDGVPFSGDEVNPYISLLDAWLVGPSGSLSANEPRTIHDTRQWIFDSNRLYDVDNRLSPLMRIHNGATWETYHSLEGSPFDGFLFTARGVDEDPSGDISRDGIPGLEAVDDNLDGLIDGRLNTQTPIPSRLGADDDEDQLVDEDPVEFRAQVLPVDSFGDTRVDLLRMGWDNDGDYSGSDPASGRVNINVAGNQNGPDGTHIYNQGSHPGELDLEAFFTCLLGAELGLQAATLGLPTGFPGTVRYRQGVDGGPGILGVDDNLNDSINFLGEGFDDDGDGLTDEEDEMLAGSPGGGAVEFEPPTVPSDLIDNRADRAQVLVNGVDDGGIATVIDDIFELDDPGAGSNPAIDDLGESRPRSPYPDVSGRDTPFATRGELGRKLVDAQGEPLRLSGPLDVPVIERPTASEMLERYITTRSSSPRLRRDSTGSPDAAANRGKVNPNLLLVQTPDGLANARPTAADLLSLAGLDNDGDWDIRTDDRNNNQLPDGDWDGAAEADITNNADDDYDGLVDDEGDANRDNQVSYDPEARIDEDPITFRGIDGEASRNGVFTDTTESNTSDWIIGDRVDNNNNRDRWMSDGIDNDFDGLTDENRLDDYRNLPGYPPTTPEEAYIMWNAAGDEGVDELDEWYVEDWDDDLDRKHDEDGLDLPFLVNLVDALDYSQDPNINDGVTFLEIPRIDENGNTTLVSAYGNEALRITEVMARPVMRLQPAEAGGWTEEPISASGTFELGSYLTTAGAFPGNWTFENIPKGDYYVAVYSFFDPESPATFALGGVGTVVEINSTSLKTVPVAFADDDVKKTYGVQFETLFDGERAFISQDPFELDGTLDLRISPAPAGTDTIAFDYVELYAPDAQYIEMCNFGERRINMKGWEFRFGAWDDKDDDGLLDDDEEITAKVRLKEDEDVFVNPGQFVVFYRDEASAEDVTEDGPSKIEALKAENHEGGQEPVVITADDIESSTGSPDLSQSLFEIVFGPDGAKSVEVYAPERIDQIGQPNEKYTLMDSFYYSIGSDFCSPFEVQKRQDELTFAPQHRGDPTASAYRIEVATAGAVAPTRELYVHGPMRIRAEDAVVTFSREANPDREAILEGAEYKAEANAGRSVVNDGVIGFATETVQNWTEYGESLLETSSFLTDDTAEITFHWPGLLNRFRNADPDVAGEDEEYPLLFVRAGGISTSSAEEDDLHPVGRIEVDDATRVVYHGDLLFVIDPLEPDDYPDILDADNDSLRITFLKDEENGPCYFAYLEITPGKRDQVETPEDDALIGRIAGDPGREWGYFPDTFTDGGDGAQFYYASRRRRLPIVETPGSGNPDIQTLNYQRSLRFREGPMANASAYLTGTAGRNIEKYSMGRNVFGGPTTLEFQQIANRLDFHPDVQPEGLINVNVADQKVLTALPCLPPESPQFSNVNTRLSFATLISQIIVMGRSQRGFDGEIGLPDVDDDSDGGPDLYDVGGFSQPEIFRYGPLWDAPQLGITSELLGDSLQFGFGKFAYSDRGANPADSILDLHAPGSDDGPYREVGDMAHGFLHPVTIDVLRRINDPSLFGDYPAGGPLGVGSLKPAGWTSNTPTLDETDVMILLGRILNLSTVQANEFLVTTRARVFEIDVNNDDPDNLTLEIDQVAEQELEAGLRR